MADLELIIFDDAAARDWYPFTLTRPAGELLLGTMTLRERTERVTGSACAGHLCSPDLAGFDEPGAPPVIDAATLGSERPRLFVSSRCVLHWDVDIDLSHETTLRVADQVAGWLVPAGAPLPSEDDIMAPGAVRGQVQTLGGTLLDNGWDLIEHNLDHIASDTLHFHSPTELSSRPANAYTIGDYPLVVSDDVTIEPGVVFDLTAGPVWLDRGASVRAFSRVAGPFYAGRGSTLLGGNLTASSIGPKCKVRGEVEKCIFLGYSNKAHDGFLGHACVGKWVNFGALTTNSDLKNNYSNVRIYTPAGEVDTGMLKMGALIGDHVKTAIGTLLITGAVIGTGAMIMGGRTPKFVPPFSWGEAAYELEKFLGTAERVMARRDIPLTASQRELLARVWQLTRSEQAGP